VEFEEARDAHAAMDNMNNGEFFGRVIKCSMAKPMSIKEGSVRPSKRSLKSLLFFMIHADDEFI
jgi:RNA recognition motif-containing protein